MRRAVFRGGGGGEGGPIRVYPDSERPDFCGVGGN